MTLLIGLILFNRGTELKIKKLLTNGKNLLLNSFGVELWRILTGNPPKAFPFLHYSRTRIWKDLITSTVCPDSNLMCEAPWPPCMPVVPGPFVNMPGFPQPKNPMPSTVATWRPARKVFPWLST